MSLLLEDVLTSGRVDPQTLMLVDSSCDADDASTEDGSGSSRTTSRVSTGRSLSVCSGKATGKMAKSGNCVCNTQPSSRACCIIDLTTSYIFNFHLFVCCKRLQLRLPDGVARSSRTGEFTFAIAAFATTPT